MLVGFSTGSLALGNVRLGLQMVEGHQTNAIELSALREEELVPLVDSLDALDLSQFNYVSVHAPSRLKQLCEFEVVAILQPIIERGWPVVVHPDIIHDFSIWESLGELLCLENMDKRKPGGRTASELSECFSRLPMATMCFDIGHARQIDPTMAEAATMLRSFRHRLRQVHLSLVDSLSAHEPLNYESTLAYRRVWHLLPQDIPVILETPVSVGGISAELEKARLLRDW